MTEQTILFCKGSRLWWEDPEHLTSGWVIIDEVYDEMLIVHRDGERNSYIEVLPSEMRRTWDKRSIDTWFANADDDVLEDVTGMKRKEFPAATAERDFFREYCQRVWDTTSYQSRYVTWTKYN